jgi:hypothetical protein
MKHLAIRSVRAPLLQAAAYLIPLAARAADTPSAADAPPPVHLSALSLGADGATPWSFSPAWFVLLVVGLPALLWVGLAWKRALEDDPHRFRRAGSRELHRLLSRIRRTGSAPEPAQLHAWCQAAARSWGVRVSTPTGTQVVRSLSELDGDTTKQLHWQELWKQTERGLYAVRAAMPPNWIEATTAAANELRIPPRKHWFPTRLRHWLPSLTTAACVCAVLTGTVHSSRAADAALRAVDAKTTAELSAAQGPAAQALRVDWNNWAAHYNVAAQQMVQGNVDYAVAHLTAAFLQHPSSFAVQNNLRWSLQQAGVMDPTLRRLLYGAWFQRYPVLMSPANWQRLGLLSALLAGAGLCALVAQLYATRPLDAVLRMGRFAAVVGIVPLVVSVMAWHTWGDLHRANAGMLVEAINLNPAPTDLVTERETIPVNAGSVTLIESAFLGWKQVRVVGVPGKLNGWSRAPYVMPLYATR